MSLKKFSNSEISSPLKIAISGGIGSGKSYVCKLIEQAGFPIFYCDDEAKAILRNDIKVQDALKALIGTALYDKEGKLNKPLMRDFICQGKEYAAQVDAIVHPRVGEVFLEWCQQQQAARVFMECALLFESGFDRYVDMVLHVSAPEEVRIQRIITRDRVSASKALEWISLQMPEAEKAQRSDYIIFNDGTKEILPQIRQFIAD